MKALVLLCLVLLTQALRLAGADIITNGTSEALGGRDARAPMESWPTLHGDWQRSGFYPHFSSSPLKLVWRKELWRELTGPRAEVITSDSLAFMGTYAGNLYAWDISTGEERWKFQTG